MAEPAPEAHSSALAARSGGFSSSPAPRWAAVQGLLSKADPSLQRQSHPGGARRLLKLCQQEAAQLPGSPAVGLAALLTAEITTRTKAE